MKKQILILTFITLLPFAACTKKNPHQQKINELSARITAMEEQYEQSESKLNSLNEDSGYQQIKQQQELLRSRIERLKEQTDQLKSTGK